jgi:hypothetical protein
MIAAVTWIASNAFLLLFAIAIVTTIVKVRRTHAARRPVSGADVFWGETLFYMVGIGYAYTGLLHAYAQQTVAPSIGWQPSPFEYELGWLEIGLALVALLSMRRGYEFRLAATLMYVIFAFAAAAQHVAQIRCCANYAPGNAGLVLWAGDIAIPLIVAAAAVLATNERSRA